MSRDSTPPAAGGAAAGGAAAGGGGGLCISVSYFIYCVVQRAGLHCT